MNDIVANMHAAETRWPQLRFKKKTNGEASASCPMCHNGRDRFLIFADGGYWCRQCNAKGWIDEEDSEWSKLDPTERRLRLLEAEQRRARHEREEQQRQLTALQRMAKCQDHIHYHSDMTTDQMEYWLNEGMTVETIMKYKLGWCPRCPTDFNGRSSYTIPVFGRDGETLTNIRHRLIGDGDGGKYRPHLSGIPVQLFNSQVLSTSASAASILVLEGEKKSICLDQCGFPNVSVMGKRSFKREWLDWLKPFQAVYIALDPDATESADGLARLFDNRARVVNLPVKADDFFHIYGGTKSDFEWFLKRARPASGVS